MLLSVPFPVRRLGWLLLVINVCCCLVVTSSLAAEPANESSPMVPYNAEDFAALRVTEAWEKYGERLTWGKGQCLAILDDGCDLNQPQWQAKLPWGPKVLVAYDAVDGDNDPAHVKPGYHGTTVGYPSSIFYQNLRGVAYHDYVAHVRAVSVVHLTKDETKTISAALRWVIDHHQQYHITTINLAVLDDQRHQEPVPTSIDKPLAELAKLGIWVSAPCGNHNYTDGISWPACQENVVAVGATMPGKHVAYLDRFKNTALLVPARATSSSNAYAAGSAIVLREAIEKAKYDWRAHGETLPEAILSIFQQTGGKIEDPKTGVTFRELDLLTALELVMP